MTPAEVVGRSPDSGMPREQGGTTDHPSVPPILSLSLSLCRRALSKAARKATEELFLECTPCTSSSRRTGQPQPNPYPTP